MQNYLIKVNNINTRTRCELCSKLTIKTPERRHWCRWCGSGVFIFNFEHISHLVPLFLLLNLIWQMPAGLMDNFIFSAVITDQKKNKNSLYFSLFVFIRVRSCSKHLSKHLKMATSGVVKTKIHCLLRCQRVDILDYDGSLTHFSPDIS